MADPAKNQPIGPLPGSAWIAVPLYTVATATQTIVEKLALVSLRDPLLLITLEVLFSMALLTPALLAAPRLGGSDLLRWVPTACLFAVATVMTKIALGVVSLGTVSLLKMCRPAFTVATETLVFRRAKLPVTPHTVTAMIVLFSGTLVYATERGFRGELVGVLAMAGAIVASTVDRLACRYLMAESPSRASNIGIMWVYYTATLVATSLAGLYPSLTENQRPRLEALRGLGQLGGIFWLLACLLSAPNAYVRVFAQRAVSATTFLVANNVAKLLIFAFGLLALGDMYTPPAVLGMSFVLFGGAYYSADRLFIAARAEAGVINGALSKKGSPEAEALLAETHAAADALVHKAQGSDSARGPPWDFVDAGRESGAYSPCDMIIPAGAIA